LLNNLGAALVAVGRHDEAFARLRQSVELVPDQPATLLNLGSYY
ncbi:unnamed protein product, partial [Phaeothamnion confervicola]